MCAMMTSASTTSSVRSDADRYQSEIAYFDAEAEEASRSLAPLDPVVVERYRDHSRRRFNKEFRLSLLAPLAGKRVLEVGCGDGEQAVLLATLGADVTGVDISPKSVSLATERAKLAGVAHRARFVCGPLTSADLQDDEFDAVWGDGILHHVIPELEPVMERIVAWSRPGARVVLTEPVNLSPTLRMIRTLVPVPIEGTPDERPLEPAELDIVRRHLPGMKMRPYLLMARVVKFVLENGSFEHSAPWRRTVADALVTADYGLLSIPAMQRFAGQVVIYGDVSK
jgi:2-polyprenyl-3-methyl-5-hydroxy-6-metoxy-1,4-benzoquinol methylase